MSFPIEDYINAAYQHNINEELDCVNTLQGTPWRVNERVLEVLERCWYSGEQWAELPARNDLIEPKWPFGDRGSEVDRFTDEELDVYKDFMATKRDIKQKNRKSMSKRIALEGSIKLAREYVGHDKFFYQWQLDFRTRKYTRESFMAPQASDEGKALILFAAGAEVNSPEDAQWLAIHGANCFGVDKVSFVDREMWVLSNTKDILEVAEDPFSNKMWLDADKPWCFLAFCFEWADYTIALGSDEVFITTLPCQVDGSCNGIQHLSAMTLDEEGGRAVNLVPNAKPNDIYGDVAAKAMETIKLDADNGHVYAQYLMEVEICRTIAKKPVMIVPYNGTKSTCTRNVGDALLKKLKGETPWPLEENYKVAAYATNHLWEALGTVIKGAREVMDYIGQIALLYGENNTMLRWVTPTGFLIEQRYFKTKMRKIKTHLDNKELKLTYHDSVAEIDGRKYKKATSPNFVHSLDAAALTKTVNKCKDLGLLDFAMIHDSFGTHSTNMPILNKALREAFVETYKDDPLLQMYERAIIDLPDTCDVPRPPSKGTLDLNEVLNSEYFFA